jgi:hypothetical protein
MTAALTKYFPTPRDAVAYIMDTFPIVNHEEKFGTYRTKDTILKSTTNLRNANSPVTPSSARSSRLPARPRTSRATSSPCPNGTPTTGPVTSIHRETIAT